VILSPALSHRTVHRTSLRFQPRRAITITATHPTRIPLLHRLRRRHPFPQASGISSINFTSGLAPYAKYPRPTLPWLLRFPPIPALYIVLVRPQKRGRRTARWKVFMG
jgi:hypothetical protein